MRQIVCEDCGKRYDYEKEEFCPKCGAFNQPVKTWTTDSQGNVRRVDGVNEQNHRGSFVHSEVHKEKRVRQVRGMDWNGRVGNTRAQKPTQGKKPNGMPFIKIIFILIGLALLISWVVLPLLSILFF